MRRAATTSCLSALLFAVFAQACRPGAAVPDDAGTTKTTSTVGGDSSGGGSCHTSAECPAKQACFYKESGCSELGRCAPEGAPSSTCYVAIAMCSCVDHRTFYGAGGCAGHGVTEPWELYACPCTTDADCHAGQKCVPTDAKPHRAGASRECRDPAPAR
jgi:hypothetical protein